MLKERRNKMKELLTEIEENALARGGEAGVPLEEAILKKKAGGQGEYIMVARTCRHIQNWMDGQDSGEVKEKEVESDLRKYVALSIGESENPSYPKPRAQWRTPEENQEGKEQSEEELASMTGNRRQTKWLSFLEKTLKPCFENSNDENTLIWHLNREQTIRLFSELVGEVQTMRGLRIDLLSGNSLLAAYREKQMGSCMGGANPQFGGVKALEYYTKNNHVVRVITLRDKDGDLMARQLIWRGVNDRNQISYFLDRMYPDNRGGTNSKAIRIALEGLGLVLSERPFRTVTLAHSDYPSIDTMNSVDGWKHEGENIFQIVGSGLGGRHLGPQARPQYDDNFRAGEVDRLRQILEGDPRPFGQERQEGKVNVSDQQLGQQAVRKNAAAVQAKKLGAPEIKVEGNHIRQQA